MGGSYQCCTVIHFVGLRRIRCYITETFEILGYYFNRIQRTQMSLGWRSARWLGPSSVPPPRPFSDFTGHILIQCPGDSKLRPNAWIERDWWQLTTFLYLCIPALIFFSRCFRAEMGFFSLRCFGTKMDEQRPALVWYCWFGGNSAESQRNTCF